MSAWSRIGLQSWRIAVCWRRDLGWRIGVRERPWPAHEPLLGRRDAQCSPRGWQDRAWSSAARTHWREWIDGSSQRNGRERARGPLDPLTEIILASRPRSSLSPFTALSLHWLSAPAPFTPPIVVHCAECVKAKRRTREGEACCRNKPMTVKNVHSYRVKTIRTTPAPSWCRSIAIRHGRLAQDWHRPLDCWRVLHDPRRVDVLRQGSAGNGQRACQL